MSETTDAVGFGPTLREWLAVLDGLDNIWQILISVALIALAIVVTRFVFLRQWERIVLRTEAEWDDLIYAAVENRAYLFVIIAGAQIALGWVSDVPEAPQSMIPYFNVAYILLGTSIASTGIRIVLPEFLDRFQRSSKVTVSGGNPLLIMSLRITVWFAGIYLALSEMSIDLLPLLGSLAVFSLIIGLAIQQTLGNIVNSFMLAIDRPFEVGDRIEVDGVMGNVMSIGILSTKVLTLNEELVVIPNNTLIDSTVMNYARGGGDGVARRISLMMDFGVAYDEDAAHVKEVITRVARDCEYVLSDPRPRVLMTELGDFAKTFRLFAWIGDYNDEFMARDFLLETVDRSFAREGIMIPYPTSVELDKQLIDSDPTAAKRKLDAKSSRRAKAVKAYEMEQERVRDEHAAFTEEIEHLQSQIRSGKLSGKETKEVRDRIRELEQSLAIDGDVDG